MLAAVTPSSVIASEKQSVLGRLLVGLLGSLLLIACVAYLAGPLDRRRARSARRRRALDRRRPARGARRGSRARRVRAARTRVQPDGRAARGRLEDLEDERRRLREANARFGDALASSLDPEQLRRVIVESAVEATQADGGVVIAEDGSFVETGDVGAGRRAARLRADERPPQLRPPPARRRRLRRRGADDGRRRSPGRRSSRSRTRGCTGWSSGRRSSTGSPASRTAARPTRRSRASSPAPSGSAGRSA